MIRRRLVLDGRGIAGPCLTILFFGGIQSVSKEHGDRQWTDASWNGSDRRCDLANRLVVEVPDKSISDSVDSDIDRYDTWLDHR